MSESKLWGGYVPATCGACDCTYTDTSNHPEEYRFYHNRALVLTLTLAELKELDRLTQAQPASSNRHDFAQAAIHDAILYAHQEEDGLLLYF